MKELMEIQTELKAPKGQYNNFGKYKYRNCEDILEALKPLLKLHKCNVLISDFIELIGDRFYVKATVSLTNESGETVSASGYAREAENKKGMDDSQITGSASSYARKYALNGLFAIDDTKDADSFDNRQDAQIKPKTTINKQGNTLLGTFGNLVGKLTDGGKADQVKPLFKEISQTFNVQFESSNDFKNLNQEYQTQINNYLQQKVGA